MSKLSETGDMAQLLCATADTTEDPGLLPSAHKKAQNHRLL